MNPNQALWEKGDFTQIAALMRQSGQALVASLGVTPPMRALDLGCGDGTTAIPLATLGAHVTGIDIARNLVAAGNRRAAELGLNPANDDKLIRIPIPALNEERRKELAKKLHGMAEDHRVALRNVRRDANDHVKKLMKDKLISEDDEKRSLDEIQKLTDATMKKLDEAAKTKEKEIMEIR